MNNKSDDQEIDNQLKDLLQGEFPPLKNADLKSDLWPQMLRRFDVQPLHVPWFDWALATVLVATLLFFPGTIPALLYHL